MGLGKFVAIEIGSKITKVIFGQDKKDDLLIKDYRLIENSDQIFNPDGDLNINEIHPLLKSVLKEMKVRKADCYLTVGGKSGMVRLREMPIVKIKEMNDIVRFEAEQFLPYDIEAFYVDFRVNQLKMSVEEDHSLEEINETKEPDVAEVMIVAAPKELVDEQVILIDKLKLNIKRVDYYTDSVYCYFKKYILDEKKNTMVVDLGSNGMKLTMFNGMQYFANIYSEVGMSDLFERYSEQNNLTVANAKEFLLNISDENVPKQELESVHDKLSKLRDKLQFKKMDDRAQNSVEFEIDPKLERLYEPIAYEVAKMMEFFKTRQFGMSVDDIYVIGGGSNMNSFIDFLSYYHNIKVHELTNDRHSDQVKSSDYKLMVPVLGSLLKGGC